MPRVRGCSRAKRPLQMQAPKRCWFLAMEYRERRCASASEDSTSERGRDRVSETYILTDVTAVQTDKLYSHLPRSNRLLFVSDTQKPAPAPRGVPPGDVAEKALLSER